MSLFDVLTLKAKEHMATYLKDVEYDEEEDWDDAKDNEFDDWWQEFVNEEFSWIDEEKLTDKNLDELAEVNHDFLNEYPENDVRVSVKEMLSRYKTWKCDPEDWNNYSLLMDMFEEQWKTKFPEAV